jgi:enterochelin esterase family protein
MRIRLLLSLVLVAALVAPSLHAWQQPAPQAPAAPAAGAAPAAAGRGGGRGGGAVKSPEIAADGRVTFRLRAPNAKTVAATVGGNNLAMQRDEQGLWSVTSSAFAPGIYTYSLVVDGTSINDPNNRQVQTSFTGFQSMFVVPGAEPWLPAANVPKGTIARHRFHSTIANDDRDFYVYTPAGYDVRRSKAYPVLYLLHGLGDDAERWINGGGANNILDNMIAQGKAVPMVVVTTLGYGTSEGPSGNSGEIVTGYAKILLSEVMPQVQKSYHVSTNREERAIAGLSMGGAEALFTGLNNLDRFAWLGSFSGAFVMWPRPTAAAAPGAPAVAAPPPPAPPAAVAGAPEAAGAAGRGGRGGRGGGAALDPSVFEKNFPALDAKANSRIKYMVIACGTADGLLGVNRQFKEWLKTKNVQFTDVEVPDQGHVWPLWRQNLTDFVQKAFK